MVSSEWIEYTASRGKSLSEIAEDVDMYSMLSLSIENQ